MGKLAKSAFILTLGMLISKAIGVFYRIPLANILGAEGIGMYQLVFSVYGLIVTIIGSGMPIAVSRLVAEQISKNKSAKSVFFSSLILSLVVGLIFSIVVYFISNYLAIAQGNSSVALGYKVISPAIFFVSGLSVLKGYFQGTINMLPTSISYILEQFIKLILGLTLAIYLAKYGIEYAVMGSLVGVTLSELVAFFVLMLMYISKRDKNSKITLNATDFTSIIRIAVPITIGSMLIPLSQFFDSFIVVNILSNSMDMELATSLYGLYSGSVTPIVNMPIMLVLTLAMIIVPVVSTDRINHDYNGILLKSKLSLKLCLIVGIPSSILLLVYAKPLLQIVYPRFSNEQIDISSVLLQIATFSIVFYGAMQIETSLMQGLDKIFIPVKNLIIAILVKELVCFILVRLIGIRGLSYATLMLSFVSCFLNTVSYKKLLGKRFNLGNSFVVSLLSGFVFFAVCMVCKNYIFNDISSILVATTFGSSIYYILIRNNNILSSYELSSLGVKYKKPIRLDKLFYRSKNDYYNRCRQKQIWYDIGWR